MRSLDNHNKEVIEKLDSILRVAQGNNASKMSDSGNAGNTKSLSSQKTSVFKAEKEKLVGRLQADSRVARVSVVAPPSTRSDPTSTGFFSGFVGRSNQGSISLTHSHVVTGISSLRSEQSSTNHSNNEMPTFIDNYDEEEESEL